MYDNHDHQQSPNVFYGTCANSANPDQTPRNVVSQQDRHCLLAECSIIIWKKIEKHPNTTQLENVLVLIIR